MLVQDIIIKYDIMSAVAELKTIHFGTKLLDIHLFIHNCHNNHTLYK